MRSLALFSITCLCLNLSDALPFLKKDPVLRPRAKYSVVAVDGSNDGSRPTDVAPATVTIVQTQDRSVTTTVSASCSQETTNAAISTTTISRKGPERTIEVTITKYLASTPAPSPKAQISIVNVAGAGSLPEKEVKTTITSTSLTTEDCSTSKTKSGAVPTSSEHRVENVAPTSNMQPPPSPAQWQAAQSSLTTISPSTPSPVASTSKTFDDGMWHSRYAPWNVTLTSSVTYPSSSSAVLPWKLR